MKRSASTPDDQITKETIKVLLTLPKRYQTSVLRFLYAVGPLDQLTGDRLVEAAIMHAASEGTREAGVGSLRAARRTIHSHPWEKGPSIGLNVVREIEFATERFHVPLLRLVVAARPIGTMSLEEVVLTIWAKAYDDASRQLGEKDVMALAEIFSLGPVSPELDAAIAWFLKDPRSNNIQTLKEKVEAVLEGPHPKRSEGSSRDKARASGRRKQERGARPARRHA